MMPDPQWVRPIEADRFLSQPCKYLELCDEGQGKSCHGDLTAALAVDWLLKRVLLIKHNLSPFLATDSTARTIQLGIHLIRPRH